MNDRELLQLLLCACERLNIALPAGSLQAQADAVAAACVADSRARALVMAGRAGAAKKQPQAGAQAPSCADSAAVG